jgi:hypothetical protein
VVQTAVGEAICFVCIKNMSPIAALYVSKICLQSPLCMHQKYVSNCRFVCIKNMSEIAALYASKICLQSPLCMHQKYVSNRRFICHTLQSRCRLSTKPESRIHSKPESRIHSKPESRMNSKYTHTEICCLTCALLLPKQRRISEFPAQRMHTRIFLRRPMASYTRLSSTFDRTMMIIIMMIVTVTLQDESRFQICVLFAAFPGMCVPNVTWGTF